MMPMSRARRRPAKLLAAAIVLSVVAASGVQAATYYVSASSGRDAASGARAQPWRSLKRAVQALRPGDRLMVQAGVYREPLVVDVSGTAAQPISIIGQGAPLIEADGDAIVLSGNYLDLEGFVAHSYGWGSAIAPGKHNHHMRIAHNIARDSACGGIAAVQTDYLTIEGNRVFGNARRAPWQCSGISIYQAEASDSAPGFHNIIRDNVVYDNMNVLVDNAVSHSDGKTTDGNGVILDDFDHAQGGSTAPPYTAATLVERNTIFDNGGRGVHVFRSSNVVVVNNVAYHNLKDPNLQRPVAELSAAFSRGVTMLNNIAVTRGEDFGLMDSYAAGPDVWDFNLVVSAHPESLIQSGAHWGGHTVIGQDPQFVRPGISFGAVDFHTRPASPTRHLGAPLRLGGPGLVTIMPGCAALGLETDHGCRP